MHNRCTVSCIKHWLLLGDSLSTLIVTVPILELSRPVGKHSTIAPFRDSVAVAWAVELKVGPDKSLIMVIVNVPQVVSAGNACSTVFTQSAPVLPLTFQTVTPLAALLWVHVREMRSPGHTVSTPLVASGMVVSVATAPRGKIHYRHKVGVTVLRG